MKKENEWKVAVLLIALVAALVGCRPATYYLEQAYKVHGKVTVAGTDPAVPLVSVEVYVGDYQYSELTNSLGDYELELPEGTWTIKFVKDGYATVVSGPIAVGPDKRRAPLDAALTWIAPPLEVTGFWDMYLTPDGGQEDSPAMLYFKQTADSTVDGCWGISGSVDGAVLTLIALGDEGEPPAEFVGAAQADGQIRGTYTMGESGTFRMKRSQVSFGAFTIGDPVGLSTDRGIGDDDSDEIRYPLRFHISAGSLQGAFFFSNLVGIWPGRYAVVPEGDDDPGPGEVCGMFFEAWQNEIPVESGTLTLTRYSITAASGSFDVRFEGGNRLAGTFDLYSSSPWGGGVATVSAESSWNGSPVSGSLGSPIWSTEPEMQWGHRDVFCMDEDLEIWLGLEPRGPFGAMEYSIPDQMFVRVSRRHDDDGSLEFEEEPTSGMLVITSYQPGVRMAGTFEGMISSGPISVTFDVPVRPVDLYE